MLLKVTYNVKWVIVMKTLGEKLKTLREKSGKTQQEIANLLCLNRVTYTQYENNKRIPPLESLKKLSEIYNVTIDELTSNELQTKNETSKISARDQRDLDKFLQQSEVMFDGELHQLDDEGREMLRDALKYAFWQAKEKNKRKPKKE